MMTTIEKLAELREKMKETGVDAYVITTDDFHASEYVGAYFREREYMSGFTGSAGTLVVLPDTAALFTDGRYFIQAEAQLAGSTIELMKSGQPGVPTIEEYLYDHLEPEKVVGFDGRTVSLDFADRMLGKLGDKKVTLNGELDLVDELWADRPELSHEPVFELPFSYTGETRADKLARVRTSIRSAGADVRVISALDEIAWLLNLRGNDIDCNPVFLSYMLIADEDCRLYINDAILNDEITRELAVDGITLHPYNEIYTDLKRLPGVIQTHKKAEQVTILLDGCQANYRLRSCILETVSVVDEPSAIQLMKAQKNSVECENERNAHIKDGVAVTKFIYWLKHHIGTETITELSAAEKLESFRKEQKGYIEPSFDTISAYGPHGAIVHYEPTEETNVELKPESFLLVDSGGQYMEGTTDITRTITLGALTEEEKWAYTLVLIGHLNLAAARFKHGTRGENLDYLAREPLWRYGLDFNHGTGHGVGYLLNVHEGPNRIHFRIMEERRPTAVFEEGMITSDEPGLYIEGRFGIRHENLVLCKKAGKPAGKLPEVFLKEAEANGTFLEFETLTWVPFDTEALIPELMTDREIWRLNEYHKNVYEKIAPHLTEEERIWLEQATSPVSKKYHNII